MSGKNEARAQISAEVDGKEARPQESERAFAAKLKSKVRKTKRENPSLWGG